MLTHAPEYVLPYLVHLLAPSGASEQGGRRGGLRSGVPQVSVHRERRGCRAHGGDGGESVPAAFKILRRLKFTQDATDADASHGMYVLTDILLLVLHKEATRRGWDTGPFPGQVAFPRAFFNLVQKPAANPSAEEGGVARVLGTTVTCPRASR